MKYILVCLVASCLQMSLASAAVFPNHAAVCIGGIVSKERLAKAILKQNADVMKIYVDAADIPNRAPKWQRILTDENFCATDPGCLGPSLKNAPPGGKLPPDNTAAVKLLDRFRGDFISAIQTNTDGRHYSMARPTIGTEYLLGPDTQHSIVCVGPEIPLPPEPTVLKLPIRVRANSDDLNIDAGRDKSRFKNVKPATVSFTRDDLAKSGATRLQATLGYAIPLSIDLNTSPDFTYFNGELVPYISASQGITKVDGKQATYAETNNVAIGALFNSQAVFSSFDGVNNVIMAKPQYLWNTKDKSEIASLKLIYQPWSFVLNTPQQLGEFLGAHWLTLIFDLRTNTGEYVNVGTDPKTAAKHTSFNRTGSKFGFALATNPRDAHLVLTVTQTLLYGFAGSDRQIDLFDSSLSYYFDSTENFAFTVSYSKGQNEDTAERAQTWTAGISAKF